MSENPSARSSSLWRRVIMSDRAAPRVGDASCSPGSGMGSWAGGDWTSASGGEISARFRSSSDMRVNRLRLRWFRSPRASGPSAFRPGWGGPRDGGRRLTPLLRPWTSLASPVDRSDLRGRKTRRGVRGQCNHSLREPARPCHTGNSRGKPTRMIVLGTRQPSITRAIAVYRSVPCLTDQGALTCVQAMSLASAGVPEPSIWRLLSAQRRRSVVNRPISQGDIFCHSAGSRDRR